MTFVLFSTFVYEIKCCSVGVIEDLVIVFGNLICISKERRLVILLRLQFCLDENFKKGKEKIICFYLWLKSRFLHQEMLLTSLWNPLVVFS